MGIFRLQHLRFAYWVPVLLSLGCQEVLNFISPEQLTELRNRNGGAIPLSEKVEFSCNENADPSPTPLRRIARVEYVNSLGQLLSGYSAGTQTTILNELSTSLSLLPSDGNPHFTLMDTQVGQSHVDAYYETAKSFAESVTSSPTRTSTIAGSCATAVNPPTNTCIRTFITTFGRRVYRRPITLTQENALKAFYDARPNTKLRDLIIRMLMSPQFLYRVEVNGSAIPGKTNLYELDNYEIASRLSFTFWHSMPDDTLLNMAGSSDLTDDQSYALAVAYVLETRESAARTAAKKFFREWLELDKSPVINPANSAAFATFAPEVLGQETALRLSMINEIETLTDVLTWDENATTSDLLLTRESFATSSLLAQLYNIQVWNGTGSRPQFSQGERSGILTRAGFLNTGTEGTSPIHRGAHLRKRLLCEDLNLPNDLPPGSTLPPPFDPNISTRQRWEAKTSGVMCQACHSMINPVGFALEEFDSIGRKRTHELLIDPVSGAVLNQHFINTLVTPKVFYSDSSSVSDSSGLMEKIAESRKFHGCMVRSYFEFTFRRIANESTQDGCAMKEWLDTIAGSEEGSVREMIEKTAYLPEFRTIKMSP